MQKNFPNLIFWVLGLQVVGILMGIITSHDIEPWYRSLTQSSLTPPDYVFSIVWPSLYLLIAIAGWLLFSKQHYKKIKAAFILQLLLNWLWTPLFFTLHLTGISLVVLALIAIVTLFVIVKSIHNNKIASLLLSPYFVWLCFAWYLNLYIFLNN